MDVPDNKVRVELKSPSGDIWAWGPENSTQTVTGRALDFCLAVTQRRHPEDTDLEITGKTACLWIKIAQAFAGPPETSPAPGERV